MKLIKKLFTVAMIAGVAGLSFADEWDDFGGFDEGSSETPTVSISGSAEAGARVYTDLRKDGDSGERYELKNMKTDSKTSAKLNFDYSGASSDVSFKLKFDNNSLGEYKKDMLDEFTARAYIGDFQIEAGKMKTVWGKGDKIHVVDNFNANDYTDFVFPDYIDRRIAEPMLRLVYSTPSNVKFEAIYTPMMTVDRLADGGIWQPYKSAVLTAKIGEAAKLSYAAKVQAAEEARILAAEIASVSDQYTAAATLYMTDMASGSPTHAYDAAYAAAGKSFTDLITANAATLVPYGLNPADNSTIAATLSDATRNYLNDAVTAQTLGLMNLSALNSDAGMLYPDTTSLKYGQAGVRTTFTLAGFDLGASYYFGHAKQPSFNAAKFSAAMPKLIATGSLSEEEKFLAYDRLQVFGLEMATVIWKFNIRGEAAYYLTEDTAGDDPWIQNNSIQWVAGFDMDMPWTNMNLNVQTQGKYIMNSDKIKDGDYKDYPAPVWAMFKALGASDVDYNSDDKYISNKVIVDVTDSYAHDSIKIDVKGIFEVETKDFVVMPSLTVKAADDFTITAAGMVIKTDNENSEFFNFRRNSFAQVSCKYLF